MKLAGMSCRHHSWSIHMNLLSFMKQFLCTMSIKPNLSILSLSSRSDIQNDSLELNISFNKSEVSELLLISV